MSFRSTKKYIYAVTSTSYFYAHLFQPSHCCKQQRRYPKGRASTLRHHLSIMFLIIITAPMLGTCTLHAPNNHEHFRNGVPHTSFTQGHLSFAHLVCLLQLSLGILTSIIVCFSYLYGYRRHFALLFCTYSSLARRPSNRAILIVTNLYFLFRKVFSGSWHTLRDACRWTQLACARFYQLYLGYIENCYLFHMFRRCIPVFYHHNAYNSKQCKHF